MTGKHLPAPTAARHLATLVLTVLLLGSSVAAKAQTKPQQQQATFQEVPATLENAANAARLLGFLGLTLTPDQKAFLNKNKFLLIPVQSLKQSLPPPPCSESWDDMLTMSDALGGDPDVHERKPENSRLITPDAVLHAYHKLFDNSLEHLENTELARQLYFFLVALQRTLIDERRAATPELAERLERIAAQVTVPLVVLESASWPPVKGAPRPVPYDAKALQEETAAALARLETLSDRFRPETLLAMRQEIENIYAAKEIAVSPLFQFYAGQRLDGREFKAEMDYTQFTPRGHYAKSAGSRAYFRAMAYLGKSQWPLDKDPGLGDALLLNLAMEKPGPGGRPALDVWKRISASATLFAGEPDEPGHEEIMNWIGWTFGDRRLTLADAMDPAVQRELAARMARTTGPKIRGLNAESGMRLIGQRATLDGWVLSRLFGERPWAAPSALFVAAALGNKTAKGFALEQIKNSAPKPTKQDVNALAAQLDSLSAEITKTTRTAWGASVAMAWLDALRAIGTDYGQAYPAYMRSGPFSVKQLQTILGSYAELKHDTLLYAKQPEAECGEGSDTPPPPVPKGFVEPGAEFWQAMIRLAELTREVFELPQWRQFEDDIRFLAEVARKESANSTVTQAEYERLRTLRLNNYAKPFDPVVVPDEGDTWTALVVDVFTDRPKNAVLYEATGIHYLMLALVGNERSPRLVAGVAFNHYEFTAPLERRMTDQDWQAVVYKGKGTLPPKNVWYKGLVPGEK